MQAASSEVARAPGLKSASAEVEELEWTGTAYGRRGEPGPVDQAPEVDDTAAVASDAIECATDCESPTLPSWQEDLAMLAQRGAAARELLDRHRIPALVAAGLAIGFALVSTTLLALARSDFLPGTVEAEAALPVETAAPAAIPIAESGPQLDELRRSAEAAGAELTREREARRGLEGKVEQLAAELAEQQKAREAVARLRTAATEELDKERAARIAAEAEAHAAKAALAAASAPAPSQDPPAASVAVPNAEAPGTATDQAPSHAAPVAPAPVEAKRPRRDTGDASLEGTKPQGPARARSGAEPRGGAALESLEKGQTLLAKGDLDNARKHFERAADLGMVEGALALGNTYDPVSLAKAGLDVSGNPTRAQQWYRRAHELALHRQ